MDQSQYRKLNIWDYCLLPSSSKGFVSFCYRKCIKYGEYCDFDVNIQLFYVRFSHFNSAEQTSFAMNTSEYKSRDELGIASPVLNIVEEVLLVFVIAASIILNFSVVFVICRNKQLMKRTTNIFILNLVISNALMAIFVMPLSLATFIRLDWSVNSVLCKVSRNI